MRQLYLKIFSILLIGSCFVSVACGGGGSSSSSDETPDTGTPQPPTLDTNGPEITSSQPADQATGFSTTATIIITFNESLDASTIDADSLTVTEQAAPVAGAVTYEVATLSINFTPDSPLEADTVYGINVANAVQDSAGNQFLGESWFFTTGGPFNLGATTQTTIDQCMDDGDKTMLTLVNNARAVNRDCGTQANAAQPPLAWNCLLDQSSLVHSTSMADNDFHAHVSPVDGSDPGDRIRATGYTPQSWGENIAAGYADEASVMDGWLTSSGHCSNIMASGFTEMGASDAASTTSTYDDYWTQNFAQPLN